MPTLCSHAVMRIIRLASSMACRNCLPATIGSLPGGRTGRRSTIPLPHNGHAILAFSFIATLRHGAPSTTWLYPVDMGGRAYAMGCCICSMSLQHPFAGLGVGTTDGGGGLEWLLVGWLLVAVAALGGGFGCSVIGSLEPGLFPCWNHSGCWTHSGIWTFGGFFQCGAAGIGAADEVARLGGGGLMQPERTGSSGTGVSSSLSDR